MDELSAHLDRGWDLVQKGDLKGARASARRALEADRNSPEAHNLLGYVAQAEGDADEALEHYRSAMSIDDGYIDPMLNAAEVLIHPLREWDEAISLCDEVLEFAEGKDEIADAILLKFDALIGKGEREAARSVLQTLPEGPFEGPNHPFLIGRAYFEAGEVAKAEPYLREAVQKDPGNPDAHYYLGLVADEQGDLRAATLSFLEAREIDAAMDRPAWSPNKALFQKSVEHALGQLEPSVLPHLNNALVLVADVPGMEIVAEGIDPRIPVLLDGLSPVGEGEPRADRVFVYQRNVERLCGGVEQIDDEIAFHLTEEVKHWLAHREGDAKPAPRGASGDGSRVRERERERDREREKPTDEGKHAPRTRKS
jgi:tetratricopeptide (TPR) repeat protein